MNRKYIHEDADLYCLGAAERIFAGSNAYDPANECIAAATPTTIAIRVQPSRAITA